jgi:two-component system sporulation sensor kinase A
MSEGVWLMDMNLKTTYISPSVTRARGYSLEELYALPLDKHVTPDSLKLALETLQEALSELNLKQTDRPLTRTLELEFYRKDGSTFWSENTFTLLMNSNGEPAAILAVSRDITERKQIEEKLRQSEDRFRGIAERSFDAILTVDLEGRITYASPAVERITGYGKNEVIGTSFQRFLPESEISKGIRILTQAVEGEIAESVEANILKKDGSIACLEFHASPILKDGKLAGFQGIARDITERKRMEEELRRYSTSLEQLVLERTKKLAESQRLAGIGEAAAMVGHDLRNPLQAIVSIVYLAKRELESPLESSREAAVKPGLVDMLETIENEVKYMDKIVSDLQDYAAPLKAEPKPVEMEPLVKDTLSKARIPRNVKVSFKVSEALQRVMADPAILRRVFINLITNAIQAMPDGGELRIDVYGTDESLFIAFKDTGVGISEENVDKLSNPFFTTKAKGQGLGLAVCKRLVEACDGRITVKSKPGEGSTFTVKLPIIKP